MSEYYVKIEASEQDQQEWNQLLHLQIRGKEYLVSATTGRALGKVGDRLWVTFGSLECETVSTVEQAGSRLISGKVQLCTAWDTRKI